MVGCQVDNDLVNVQSNVQKTFYATFENGADARTSLDDSNNTIWSEDDLISVFGGTSVNESFILQEGAGTTFGKFGVNSVVASTESGSAVSALSANVAYYPYNGNVTVSEGNGSYTLNATFPTEQTFTTSGTFGNGASPMVAVTSNILDANLKFKNVGAIFRLQLKGEATITRIVFSANADLAGECNITASNTTTPTVSVTDGANSITLDCGEGVELDATTPTNFIVAMLPVANITGGITIEIFDNAGMKMVYTHKESETITFERSKAYSTAEVTYNGDCAVTAEGAQTALDTAVAGTTIQLVPGVNYGTLVFRQNANKVVVDITEAGGDAPGNEHYSKYENITIIGAEGAVVDQIDFQVSWVPNSGASYVEIKNLTLKDITFSGEKTAVNLEGAKGSALGIDGLRIENCKMVDADSKHRLVFQQITGYKELKDKSTDEYVMTTGVKNLTITNCEVTNAYMVIESRAMENLTITNNLFNGIKERDMLITSDTTYYPGVTYTGTITITGNTSICGEERFVRGSGFGDATVVIKDNTIINYLGEDDDYIKCDGTNTTIENNIVKSYGAYDSTTLGRAFARVSDNGSIVIVKDAALLAIPNAVTAKNVTISAYEGVKVGTLYQIGCGHCSGGILSLPENLTISGITFDSNVGTLSNGNYCSSTHTITDIEGLSGFVGRWSKANGLTFSECNFINGAAISVSYGGSKDVVVENSTFQNTLSSAVSCYATNGVTVTGCTMDNVGFAAIFAGDGSSNITFTGNTVGSTGSRLVRLNKLADGSSVTIKKNTFGQANTNPQEASENGAQIVKISASNDLNLTCSNNTYKGDEFPTIAKASDGNWYAYETISVSNSDELTAAIKTGAPIALAKDITLEKSIAISNANFNLNGNGHTIRLAEGGTNTYALFDITGGKVEIANVTFDGIKSGAIVRTVGVEFTADNVTAINGNHTQVQGLFRLHGKSTIKNSTFKNNNCNMVVTLNYDSANNDPQVVESCVFEGNICNKAAVVYYVKGAGCTVNNNVFKNNTVIETDGNAATLYMGFTENNVITNNVFNGNNVTGTTKRVAGGLMIGYAATITGNSFTDNTVTGPIEGLGNDVCASVYYTDIDLSGNYWGGDAPVAGDDYYQEYTNHSVIINDYLTTWNK